MSDTRTGDAVTVTAYQSHILMQSDLTRIGYGQPGRRLIRVLQDAVLSKHLTMLETIRRSARSDPMMAAAWQALCEEQARNPRRAMRILRSPQVGAWAADSIASLRRGGDIDAGCLSKVIQANSKAHRIQLKSSGLTLHVTLDTEDPLRSHFGMPISVPHVDRWHDLFREAWRILTVRHERAATILSWLPLTLVPLRQSAEGPALSATSGWAFGAIAISLPPRGLDLAEILIHEYRHLLLGVVEDMVPLVDKYHKSLFYAPWRRDLRPAGGMLQGSYAHAAITEFWRTEWQHGPDDSRQEAAAAFVQWRHATVDALERLIKSGALTASGRELAEAAHQRLTPWLAEAVPSSAAEAAAQRVANHKISAHHRLNI